MYRNVYLLYISRHIDREQASYYHSSDYIFGNYGLPVKRAAGRKASSMANDKKQTNNEAIDPYTGEETPPVEDADKFDEIVPVDHGDRTGENYLLEEETSMDHIAANENADAVFEQLAHYTEDEDIEADFQERQQLAVNGRRELKEELEEHHSKSPRLSGGDLDADWQSSDVAGEEAVGGSTPTPDQDVVDELGEALGITYADDEQLNGEEKLRQRDRDRWELDPESARDEFEFDG